MSRVARNPVQARIRAAKRIARDLERHDTDRAQLRLLGFGRKMYLKGLRARRALDLAGFMAGRASGEYAMLRVAHSDFEHRRHHNPNDPLVPAENRCRVCLLLDALEPVANGMIGSRVASEPFGCPVTLTVYARPEEVRDTVRRLMDCCASVVRDLGDPTRPAFIQEHLPKAAP